MQQMTVREFQQMCGEIGAKVNYRYDKMNQWYYDVDTLSGPMIRFIVNFQNMGIESEPDTIKFTRDGDTKDDVLTFVNVTHVEIYESDGGAVNFAIVCDSYGDEEKYFMTAEKIA